MPGTISRRRVSQFTAWQRDAEQEQIDVQHYLKLAELAGAEGQIALKLKMEEQAADEQSHRQELLRLLG